jgi:hypothetical protein
VTPFATVVHQSKPASLKLFAEGKVGARLVTYPSGVQAVMKVASKATTKHNRSVQRGIATEGMPKREVAFYRLSQALGWDVVPETVLGEFQGFEASFQQYVTSAKLYDVEPRLRKPDEKEAWIVALRQTLRDKVPFDDTLRLTVLDFLACARDRHAANYGARLDVTSGKARWRIVAWDNGCSFGLTQAQYHCVAHKYLFRYAFDLSPVWETLKSITRSKLFDALNDLLSPEAIDHVWMRVQFMLLFPHRMPWQVLSNGSDDPESFPDYRDFFKPMVNNPPLLYVLQTQPQ